jgi:hypothetical protein
MALGLGSREHRDDPHDRPGRAGSLQGGIPSEVHTLSESRSSAEGDPGSLPRPGRSPGPLDVAFGFFAGAVFLVMWLGFAFALILDPAILDDAWEWLTGLPMPVSLIVWVLILPIGVGLWIWQGSWAPVVGASLAAGMVAWTIAGLAGLRRAVRAF